MIPAQISTFTLAFDNNNDGGRLGLECPTTSLEDYMRKEDWSVVLGNEKNVVI